MTKLTARRGRLDGLWTTLVFGGDRGAFTEADHLKAGLEQLLVERAIYLDAVRSKDYPSAIHAQGRALAVWVLLTTEAMDWAATDILAEFVPGISEWQEQRPRQRLLSTLLDTVGGIPQTHREAIDPIPVLLSREMFVQLGKALQALDEGEIQDLVAPSTTGRHDDSWSWDQMRCRALQYIAFLEGQGLPITRARQRVGAAMSVSPITLRKWEKQFPEATPDRNCARAAGMLRVERDSDPNYLVHTGTPRVAPVIQLMRELEAEPLVEFGRAYKERFGARHIQQR